MDWKYSLIEAIRGLKDLVAFWNILIFRVEHRILAKDSFLLTRVKDYWFFVLLLSFVSKILLVSLFCFHVMEENNLISSDNYISITLSLWKNLFAQNKIYFLHIRNTKIVKLRWNKTVLGILLLAKIKFNSL